MTTRKLALCAPFLAALFLAPSSVSAQSEPQPASNEKPRKLTVNASATVSAAPDRVRISFSVQNEASTAGAASTANAEVTSKVVAALEEGVGDDGRVVTSGYSLGPRYEYHNRPGGGSNKRQLVGYTASNSVTATMSDLASAGDLIDTAVAAGATNVAGVMFFLADETDARNQALIEAGRRAREKAEAIAEGLGVTIGRVLEVSSHSQGPQPYARMESMRVAADSASAPTPISAGDIDLQMAVTVVFELP